MKLATTTEDFNRFCGTYRDRVTCLYEAGFRYIDLSFYDVKQSAEFLLDEHWKENARELKAYAQELGMQFVQAHSPGGNPFADTEDAKKLIPVSKTFKPDMQTKKVYDKYYEVYKNLYASNKKNFAQLNS